MSEVSQEKVYYIQTSLMFMEVTRKVLLKLFQTLTKTEDIAHFLLLPDQQNKLAKLHNEKSLNETEYKLVSGHVLDIERLDISLLLRLILHLCEGEIPNIKFVSMNKPDPKDESLGADLVRLRDVRNKIIGHRGDPQLSFSEYEHTWEKVKVILLRVVQQIDPGNTEYFEKEILRYKELTVDTEDVRIKKLMDDLLKYKTEMENLQKEVEKLFATTKELKVFFKTTPERFLRYIKLLFEGGNIVLCGLLQRLLSNQNLQALLHRRRDKLKDSLQENYFRFIFPDASNDLDYKGWDIDLLASVLLSVFDEKLSQKEKKCIIVLKESRINYAEIALNSLDMDTFLEIWTDLNNSLKDLSNSIDDEKRLEVENLIERYKKKDSGGCSSEEYLKQLNTCGFRVKTLTDVYNETITHLIDMVKELSEKGFMFKQECVIEVKLLTNCANEEAKRKAEDSLERYLKASLQGSDDLKGPIRNETDNLVARIAAHPHITPGEVKRKCIILSFKCSTACGLLYILDHFNSDHFTSILNCIANELHYMYGAAFFLQGHFTLESLSRLSMLIASGTKETQSEQVSLPLSCSSVEGIKYVISQLKQESMTNTLNKIAEQISTEVKEAVTLEVFPDLMTFTDALDNSEIYDEKCNTNKFEDMAALMANTVSSKFFNWIKAALAVLLTKEEVEPVVHDVILQFQQKCLQDIVTSNNLPTCSTCSNCSTENVVTCPFDRACNSRLGKCSYHKKRASQFHSSGCPQKICHHMKSMIDKAHRFKRPAYQNTDASQWCNNPWEIAKCYLPSDGYNNVTTAGETDFIGISSIIINHKEFDSKFHDDLSKKNNIFDQGREVCKAVGHSPNLEVEDTDLAKYFAILNDILSDPGFIAINKTPHNARQKLAQLQNDELVIGKDVIRKVLKESGRVIQEQIRKEMVAYRKETEVRKLELIGIIHAKVAEIKEQGDISMARLKELLKSEKPTAKEVPEIYSEPKDALKTRLIETF